MNVMLTKACFIRILRILFFLYCLMLILFSILPINGESSPLNDIYIVKIRVDYLLHTIIFLPFLSLAMLSLSNPLSRKPTKKLLFLIITGLLFAIIIECIQLYLSYRSFNINDLIANSFGIILGLPIILLKPKIRANNPET